VNVDLSLVSVARVGSDSIICTFSLFNRTTGDKIRVTFDDKSYVLSSTGTKYKPLSFEQATETVPGERKTIKAMFGVQETGVTANVVMSGYVSAGLADRAGDVLWQPVAVTLP